MIAAPRAAEVMRAALADALAEYVRHGGRLALFPDSGRWIADEPSETGGLLRRLGWRGPVPQAVDGARDVGNSGLAAGPVEALAARIAEHSTALGALSVLPIAAPARLTNASGEVHAAFADGSPAAVSWQCGRGQVLLLAGAPQWDKAAGLFQALYQWAGGRRDVQTQAPSIMINHLVKGPAHYILVHRGPDSLSPRLPTLDRARLQAMPAMATQYVLRGLQGRWRITELTDRTRTAEEVASADLARGLPVSLHLGETKIFRLQPLP